MAETITFAPLAGANGDPYLGHTEGHFTVTPTAGEWFVAQAFGNPTPDIYGGPIGSPLPGSIQVTENTTGLFTFGSVDLSGNVNPTATYDIEGFRGGLDVLSATGTLGTVSTFVTIPSPNTSQVLDLLTISITPNSATSFNVDNISVTTAVPEPAGIVLAGLGGLVLLAHRRRRRRLSETVRLEGSD